MSRKLGDFELPEPKKPSAESPRVPPAHPAKHGFNKLVIALATLATIIGGVAAAVQLWAYWNPEKPRQEQPVNEQEVGWIEIRPGFKAKFGAGWEILDRAAYDAAARIQFGNLQPEATLGEKHYLVRAGDASRSAGFAMLAITNVSPSGTIEGLVREARDQAMQNNGMIAPRVSLDSAEIISTDAGDCARFIAGVYDTEGAPLMVMSSFIWYHDGQSFTLYFYSLPNEANIDSPECLRIAKSVRFS